MITYLLLNDKENAIPKLSEEQFSLIETYNLQNSDERGFIDYVIDMPKLIDSYLSTLDFLDIITKNFVKICLVLLFVIVFFWEGDAFLMIADFIDFFYEIFSQLIVFICLATSLRGRVELPR